jgi:hypothetical protein
MSIENGQARSQAQGRVIAEQEEEIRQLKVAVERLRVAILPLAILAPIVDALRHPDESTCPHRLNAGDIRKAAKALTMTDGLGPLEEPEYEYQIRWADDSGTHESDKLDENAARASVKHLKGRVYTVYARAYRRLKPGPWERIT